MAVITRNLHPGQARAWSSNKRYVSVVAGTGGGKTWFGPIWLYREITGHPGEDFLVVAPTYGLLQRVTFPEFMRFIGTMMPGILSRYKAMERTLYLPTGGRVFFGSADRPVTLEGVHVRAVWLDEAGQMKREAWEVATRRVGHKKGRILITTTPYNVGWLKLEVYDRWKADDPDYDVIQFASVENPSYPMEEFERARKTLPDWKFNMFYKGQFTRASGLVYQDLDQGVHIIERTDIPKSWPRYMGVDFGFTAPCAAVWGALSPEDELIIYREYYRSGKLAEESAQEIIDKMDADEKVQRVYGDPEDPASIAKYNRLGLNTVPADNSILDGITEVIGRLRTKQLFITKGCSNLLDEAEQYQWKGDDDDPKDEPVHKYCHALDALRYLVMGVKGMALRMDTETASPTQEEVPSLSSRQRYEFDDELEIPGL